MTGVCPIPLLSPAQFTEAACQFRYAPYTQNAYIYCMYACLHVDFFKYVRVWMLHHNPSHRSLTLFLPFIFSHSEPIEPSARHQIEGEKSCGKRVALLLWHSETENSVFCVRVTDAQSFLDPLSPPHI